MNILNTTGPGYSRELKKILFPHDYPKIITSIILGTLLSGSQGPNTEKDPLCEIGPKYSKTEGSMIKILDCKTGVTLSEHDISNLLIQNPIK